MKHALLSAMFLAIGCSLQAQSPGGVGKANLTGWWDASTLSTGNVTSWTSSWPTGANSIVLTESAAPYPVATNTPLNATSNYNTTIDFNGNTATLPMVLENPNNLNLLDQRLSTSEGTFFTAYYLPATQIEAGCHIINYREATSGTVDGIQLRAKLGANTGRCAIGTGNSANASRDWVQDFVPDIISYYGNRTGTNTMRAFERGAEFTGGVASGTSGDIGLRVGSRRAGGGYSGMFDGFISELIFFNRNLNPTEMSQVNTYLGIKYGISLENTTGGGDYIGSSGSVIWDASANPGFQNEIIGLARDDSSGLYQKQSHHFVDNLRIYIGALAATNAANAGVIATDNSYVIIGNDQGSLCGGSGSGNESPSSPNFYLSRLSREWKVSKMNFSQPFNLEIEIDTCSTPGGLNASLFHLLVDDDGDFSDATAYPSGGGLNIAYSAGMVTVTGISDTHIPADSTRFITLAYGLPLVTVTGDSVVCAGDSSTLTLSIVGASGPMDVLIYDGTNVTTYPNAVDGDVIPIFPTANVTYSTLVSGPLHCCQAVDTSSWHAITISPLPTINASVSPDTVCPGDFVLFSGSGAATYTWTGGVINGAPFVAQTSGTYVVTGTDLNNCQDTASVYLEVYSQPNPFLGQDTIVCTGDTLVLNAGSFSTYLWQDNSTASTFTATNTVPGIYTYSVSVTDSNFCNGTDTILVDFSVCIGVEDQVSSIATVFPNPATGDFMIKLNEHLGSAQVRIQDAFGREVYAGNHAGNLIRMQLPQMASGIYFIEVEGEGFREVLKLRVEK